MKTRVFIFGLFHSPIPVGLIPDIPSKWHAGIYDWLALAHLQVTLLSEGSNVNMQLGHLGTLGKEAATRGLTVIVLWDFSAIRMRNIWKCSGMYSCSILIPYPQMENISFFEINAEKN